MKSTVQGLALLLFVIGSVACGHHDADHDAADHDDHGTSVAGDSDHGLTLDGNRKWEMDEHTRAVFATMSDRLQEIDGDGAGEITDETADEVGWQQTGAVLRQDIDELIAGCTMQGPAHDQLHTFLSLYIPAVDELASSGTPDSATRVRELIEIYPTYFE